MTKILDLILLLFFFFFYSQLLHLTLPVKEVISKLVPSESSSYNDVLATLQGMF